MPDWTKSMKQSYEYYIVNPTNWRDVKPIRSATKCTVKRDESLETLGCATFDCDEVLKEVYIRPYLVTYQNGVTERFPLGTFLVQTPSTKCDGMYTSISVDAYTPLLELKDNLPELGYSEFKGSNTLDRAYSIVSKYCRAPVIQTFSDHTLNDDFIANTDDTWLTYVSDLLTQAKYTLGLDELGKVLFKPVQEFRSLSPVAIFDDGNSSILYPEVSDTYDLYGVPNVLEMIYTTPNNETYTALVENNDPNSAVSIVNRGRIVKERITSPQLPGEYSEEDFQLYAKQYLINLSSIEHTITFSHGFMPINIGDCVLLNYKKPGLKNVRARIIRQQISCDVGCKIEATATYTEELWNGD